MPALALVRLNALGEHPVGIDEFAASGQSVADIAAQLDHLDAHWVRRDGDQLTLDLSQHTELLRRRIRIGEREFLVSGCAPDVLAFAAVIDRPLQFEETCPATGTTIRVDLTPMMRWWPSTRRKRSSLIRLSPPIPTPSA
jgi:alkylmercury lyase